MPRHRPHVAARPSWRCRICGAAWPCSPARLALLGEYREDRIALLVYLGTLLCEATTDLATVRDGTAPQDLAQRFVAWARTPRPTEI
ncbi:flavin reductase [Micromonospora sp. WMMD1128]|uniref:flavin reductase n=1 Tax=unclassified Micromonospora TaxID=2617518 RepID=UPI00248B9A83|nr:MULTISPECIES: flavin reductase [unclassified Micromonospora]WBB75038.1 flavin reductase [Micromonospora sp. WMMD1128]WFE31588.1 flavin reductase [Micromonospora sp. WMMD975]